MVAFSALGCTGEICTADALTEALRSAGPGDVVGVGACEIRGSFVVPAGVTLRGSSPLSSLGSLEDGSSVVELSPSTGTALESITILVDHGGLGVRAVEGPAVELRGVTVRVTRGIAVGLRDLERATVSDVELVGPLTAATAPFAPTSASETGTFGLVAVGVGGGTETLYVTGLRARGFALGAVSIQASVLRYEDTDALVDLEATRFLGLALFDTEADVTGVELGGLFSGVGLPAIAIAATSMSSTPATLNASDIVIAGGEGYGLFVTNCDLVLTRAALSDLGQAAIRLQGGTLTGVDLTIERNAAAGIAAIDARAVSVESSTIAEQREGITVMPDGSRRTADGMQVIRDAASAAAPPLSLALSDVRFERNARAGLLLDAADSAPGLLALTRVSALAEGPTSFGVVKQRTVLPADWDAAVVREGTAVTNDLAFPEGVDVFGIMMPPALGARPPSF